MLCPYCGEEMDKGLVQSSRSIFWSQEKKRVLILPDSEDDIEIGEGGYWGSCVKESYVCRECKKIVIDLIKDKV